MESLSEIRSIIGRHVRLGEISTVLPGVRLMGSAAPTDPVNAVYQPAFALVVQGAKRTTLAGNIFEYSAGQYLVVSVDLPIVGQVFQASRKYPYLAVAMTLNPQAIATLVLEGAGDSDSGSEPQSALGVSNASPDLLDSVTRLLRLIDRPNDVKVLGPMLEREILWRLLTGEQGAMVRQVGLADGRLSRIGRAIQWIRSHYADTCRVDELARVATMSPPTFFRHFRAVTQMSPLQYQKKIRLLEARARLVAKSQDVAAVGFDVGYESASQFSREYRRLFGVPPGKDVANLRALAERLG